MKSYGETGDYDRHANTRDKKRDKRQRERLMRGNRSVFEIEKAIAKRGRQGKKDNDE